MTPCYAQASRKAKKLSFSKSNSRTDMLDAMLKVGDTAPDIDAVATSGDRVVLSQLKKPFAVVYFFPKAFTPDCTREAKLFQDNFAELSIVGAEVIGISTDSLETQCKFAQSLKVTFPLIADANKKISASYDVLW